MKGKTTGAFWERSELAEVWQAGIQKSSAAVMYYEPTVLALDPPIKIPAAIRAGKNLTALQFQTEQISHVFGPS